MGWRDFIKSPRVDYVDYVDKVNEAAEQSPLNPHSGSSVPIETQEYFEERAAIKEYEAEKTRVEAELEAIEEVLPYLDESNVFHIDSRYSSKRLRCGNGGRDAEIILKELGASEETIKRYVQDKTGGMPKPEGEL